MSVRVIQSTRRRVISPFLLLKHETGLPTQIAARTGFVVGVGFWLFANVVSVELHLMCEALNRGS